MPYKQIMEPRLFRKLSAPLMSVFLIHDPRRAHNNYFKLALYMQFGSFEDPIELQGLSHYLEHAIFLDDTKSAFDDFIVESGGFSNAATFHDAMIFALEGNPAQWSSATRR